MKIAQLKTIVSHGESNTLEFKSSTSSIGSGMQTVCAFLNSDQGGMVVFGVTDNGKIVGQEVTDKTRKEIATELNKIDSYENIDVLFVHVGDDKQAIVFEVAPADTAPCLYDGRAYIRNQSTTTRMSKEEYRYLYNKNNPALWESLATNTCTLKNLDRTRIKEVIRMAISEKRLPSHALNTSIPNILKKFKLIVDDKLTNAAVILFCKNEDKQFIQSSIQLARFRGIDKTQFLDTKFFVGNAFDLYDKADEFLSFFLPVAAHIEQGNPIRVETPAIPYAVLREALINALIHRDYSNAGGSISIAVYDDRVNITNIGALPKGVTLSELSKEHASIQRNPLIANVFYLCGKIEKWGRGTLDMIEACKKVGNPIPRYEEIGGTFSVTLPLKEPIPTIVFKQGQKIDLRKLTDRQIEIIDALKTGALSRQQLMSKMKTRLAERTVQLELFKLKDMGLVKSEGKAKAIIWSLVGKLDRA
jgi:ATP-dependent DNA helicase RecG